MFQRINNVHRYTDVVSGATNCSCPVGRLVVERLKNSCKNDRDGRGKGLGIVRDREVNMISQPLMTLRVQIRAGL